MTSSPTKATPLRLVVGIFERIDHRPVVLAVAARLHDHVLVEAEEVAQREQLFLGRVAGRVFALGREGKPGSPARTHGSARRPRPPAAVFRLRRIGMKRNVAGTHRHGSISLRMRCLGSPPRARDTQSRNRACVRTRRSDPLERQRNALPHADAHGGERALAAALLQAVRPRSARGARPTCRADARARSRRRAD